MPSKALPYSEDTRRRIGQNIRRLRQESEISPELLADGVGITRGYWYEVEAGIPNVTLDVLDRIAGQLSKALKYDVTIIDLLTEQRPSKGKRKELTGSRK